MRILTSAALNVSPAHIGLALSLWMDSFQQSKQKQVSGDMLSCPNMSDRAVCLWERPYLLLLPHVALLWVKGICWQDWLSEFLNTCETFSNQFCKLTPQSLKRGLQKVDHYLDFHDFSWSVFTVLFWPQAAWHLLCIKVLAKILLSAHTYILYRLVKVTSPLCSKAKCGLQCCQCAVSTFKVAATAHASLSVNSWMNYRGTSAPVCTIELLHLNVAALTTCAEHNSQFEHCDQNTELQNWTDSSMNKRRKLAGKTGLLSLGIFSFKASGQESER